MNSKAKYSNRSVHRFSDNTFMKFRPLHLNTQSHTLSAINQEETPQSFTGKISSMFSKLFTKSNITQTADSNLKAESKTQKENSLIAGPPSMRSARKATAYIQSPRQTFQNQGARLKFLQKISTDTFLIGNQNQIDLITICGILDNYVDTDFNWSLNIKAIINKVAVDLKKSNIAMLTSKQVQIYRFDVKKPRTVPKYINRIKANEQIKSITFLKESLLAVFYEKHAVVYFLQENNALKVIFNEKYGIKEDLIIYQIPKPIDNTLNIFFKEYHQKNETFTLWRLEMDYKSNNISFKAIQRIYDVDTSLENQIKLETYTKEIFLINFKVEICAAKDGYIIDSVKTNSTKDPSCLIYNGQNLLLITNRKMEVYKFEVLLNINPNKISTKSIDAIEVFTPAHYEFFDCLQMLNGNFVIFFQISSDYNKKGKGEIDYSLAVTQKLSIQDKLNEIFKFQSSDQLSQLSKKQNFHILQEKCDMAFKIGLPRIQIFLQLWNKSNKKTVQDFKFLLDTYDYETIKAQIEKKLKKSSMTFYEVFKIEQSCFEMLQSDVESPTNCTERVMKNYLTSHFLLRKLIYFRDITLLNKSDDEDADGKEKKMMINIQQYTNCLTMELKSQLLDYVYKFCFQNQVTTTKIRVFLRSFKFPFRVMYKDLLMSIISTAKNQLYQLLIALPQFLPYEHMVDESEDRTLYEGIWGDISSSEWQKNLYLQKVMTLYNKQVLKKLQTQDIWFKRNLYSQHDLICLTKDQIIKAHEFNESDNIFYLFIEKMFNVIKDEAVLRNLVDYLEINYARMPEHLRGKVFLYRNLYSYFELEMKINPNLKIDSMSTFLKMKDFQVFKTLFDHQKVKKGCLLREAKTIYDQMGEQGNIIYNEGLLNYFASDLSQISDLKYILNRLNNEKREFHKKNEGMYEVLVKGMQMKMRLGSQNDIPLDEVIIYIENIPLSKNNLIMDELQTVQRINEQADLFKEMKINMSILQIIQNCEDVMTEIIRFQIEKKGVMKMRDPAAIKGITYKILAKVQTIKQKIYKGEYSDLSFFLYLSKIMEDEEMIPYAKMLLEDAPLVNFYSVQTEVIQNLVLFMYKWKFDRNSKFSENEQYITALLQVLQPDNECRVFIECQLQFALMLSGQFPIEYPLTQSSTITVVEIEEIFNKLSGEYLLKIDLERLHELVAQMQELCVEMETTPLSQIYELVLMRLINLKMLKESIPIIKKLIAIYGDQQNYTVVYCVVILVYIFKELPQQHKTNMTKIVLYALNDPLKLLEIIETMMNTKFSHEEEGRYLEEQLVSVMKVNKCYNQQNQILQHQYLIAIKTTENQQIFAGMIYQCLVNILQSREEFAKQPQFTMIFIILTQNPYAFAKFYYIQRSVVNLKLWRSFISALIREQIFNPLNVLQLIKRLFNIILQTKITIVPLQIVISQYKNIPLDAEIEFQQFQDLEDIDQIKIKKTIDAFALKIGSIKEVLNTEKIEEILKKKRSRIDNVLNKKANLSQKTPSEYPLSDDNEDNLQITEEQLDYAQARLKKKKSGGHFDARQQRILLMNRNSKNIALYLSANENHDFKSSASIRKTTPNMIKNSKSFALQKGADFSKSQRFSINRAESLAQQQDDSDKEGEYYNQSLPLPEYQSQQHSVKSSFGNHQTPKKVYESMPYRNNLNIDSAYSQGSSVEMHNEDSPAKSSQDFGGQFKVNINQIDEDAYVNPQKIIETLFSDYDEASGLFDLAILVKEEEKQNGDFIEYLKNLITCAYKAEQKPFSLVLALIKQIVNQYPTLIVSKDFLQIYVKLENFQAKYNLTLRLRSMFPIQGIFIDSKTPKDLFDFVRPSILAQIDENSVIKVSKIVHLAFKSTAFQEQLIYSYLCKALEKFNDQETSEQEQSMQLQRLAGLIERINVNTLFFQGKTMLKTVTNPQKRQQIIDLFKENFKKKKKDALAFDFDRQLRKK